MHRSNSKKQSIKPRIPRIINCMREHLLSHFKKQVASIKFLGTHSPSKHNKSWTEALKNRKIRYYKTHNAHQQPAGTQFNMHQYWRFLLIKYHSHGQCFISVIHVWGLQYQITYIVLLCPKTTLYLIICIYIAFAYKILITIGMIRAFSSRLWHWHRIQFSWQGANQRVPRTWLNTNLA